MTAEELNNNYSTVCNMSRGNGFRVERMPDFFETSEVDDCMAHVHSFYEILWFQEGTGVHTVDFNDYEVKPGTIFFLAPGQVHHFDRKEGYKGVAIKMCTDMMKDNVSGGNADSLFLKYNSFHTYDSTPYYIIDDKTARMLMPLVYIAYDAVFSKMRQYLSEGIERIFYRRGIDYQFRMEILYFFHIGEAVAIVHKAKTFWVYIIYSYFVFKA